MEAYSFANHLWKKGINLFSPSGLYNMLELNHIVLCGTDKQKRLEYFCPSAGDPGEVSVKHTGHS